MDNSGKIIWAKHNEIQTANIKAGHGMMKIFYQYLIFFLNCKKISFNSFFNNR
jgi:hypothetical protein